MIVERVAPRRLARTQRRFQVSKTGALVLGVISLLLSAGSITLGFVNRVHHPRRFIGFIVLCGIFLVVAIVLFVAGGRGKAAST